MKRKRLDRDIKTGWGFEAHPYYQMRVDIEDFHGLVCLIKLTDERKLPRLLKRIFRKKYICWNMPKAGKVPVCGGGMTWLQMIPDGKQRVITAKYMPDNSLSLCYIDVIENIEYDTDGVVIFVDKYLDVVFTPQGDMEICDRDELDEAFQSGELSQEQYESALKECDSIVDELCSDINKTEIFYGKILAYVNDRIEKGEKQFKQKQ